MFEHGRTDPPVVALPPLSCRRLRPASSRSRDRWRGHRPRPSVSPMMPRMSYSRRIVGENCGSFWGLRSIREIWSSSRSRAAFTSCSAEALPPLSGMDYCSNAPMCQTYILGRSVARTHVEQAARDRAHAHSGCGCEIFPRPLFRRSSGIRPRATGPGRAAGSSSGRHRVF